MLNTLVLFLTASENYVGIFGGYVGPFGGRAGTMLGSLGLSWRRLKAMLGHLEAMLAQLDAVLALCSVAWDSLGGLWRLYWPIWRLCWAYVGNLGAPLPTSEGYVGPCGGHAETMLGTLGLSRRLLTIIMDHLEAMLKLCSVTSGSVGGFWGLRRAIWRPCWDYVGHLLALLATILCRLEALLAHLEPILEPSWGA